MDCPHDAPQKPSKSLTTGAAEFYVFDRFRVDVLHRRLYEGDRLLRISPKAVQLLALLIANRDHVVEKEHLIAQLWPDRFVSEANLTQHVFTLRRALDESPEQPRFIVTVARQGYRFVGTLRSDIGATENPLKPEAVGGPFPYAGAHPLAGRMVSVAALVAVAAALVWWVRPIERVTGAPASEAYRLYERGKYFWSQGYDNPASLESARESFLHAVAIEPNFARGYAGLAITYSSMAVRHLQPPETAYRELKVAAERALRLDSSVAEAHYALGAAAFRHDWDWNAAERELQLAIDLDPSFADAHQLYGDFLTDMRRFDDALRELGRAVELDPQWGIYVRTYARALAAAGRLDDAIAEYRRALSRDPNSYRLFLRLSELHERKGAYEEAVTLRARAEELATGRSEPGDLAANGVDGTLLLNDYRAYGFAAAMRAFYQRKLAALEQEQKQNRYISPFTVALVHARLGNREKAIVALQAAAARRTPELVAWHCYPELAPLAGDSRIRTLLQTLRIPID